MNQKHLSTKLFLFQTHLFIYRLLPGLYCTNLCGKLLQTVLINCCLLLHQYYIILLLLSFHCEKLGKCYYALVASTFNFLPLPNSLRTAALWSKYTSLYKLPGIWITSWWRSNIILFPCPHHFLHSRDLFHLCNNESSWQSARVCLNGTEKVLFKQRWKDTRECLFWRSERAGWQNRRQSMLLCAGCNF